MGSYFFTCVRPVSDWWVLMSFPCVRLASDWWFLFSFPVDRPESNWWVLILFLVSDLCLTFGVLFLFLASDLCLTGGCFLSLCLAGDSSFSLLAQACVWSVSLLSLCQTVGVFFCLCQNEPAARVVSKYWRRTGDRKSLNPTCQGLKARLGRLLAQPPSPPPLSPTSLLCLLAQPPPLRFYLDVGLA